MCSSDLNVWPQDPDGAAALTHGTQWETAISVAEEWKNIAMKGDKTPDFLWVGHSLGGGLVHSMVGVTGFHALVFNSKGFGYNERRFSNPHMSYQTYIDAVTIPGEFLTGIQTNTIADKKDVGHDNIFPMAKGLNPFDKHSMSTICNAMNHDPSCGGVYGGSIVRPAN